MRKPTFLVLALMGAASFTLGIPGHGYAAGPSLPIVGKLPIPAPPSVPGVPSLPGGLPSTPSLPSLPSLGAPSTGSLPALPSDVSPTDLVTQNVAYLEAPGGLSPAKVAALLQEVSGTVLPLVPNAPEDPSILLAYGGAGAALEIATLPSADRALFGDLVGAAMPGSPEAYALEMAAEEVASDVAASPLGPDEKSQLTPALETVVHNAQPALNQTATQLDELPSLPSLPKGTLPSTSSAPSLPSTTSLTKMAALPKSSSLPSSSSVTKETSSLTKTSSLPKSGSLPKSSSAPSTSSVTKKTSSLTKTSSLPKSSSLPSSSTVKKEANTSTVTRMTKTSSATKSLPKS
jgi:hypothetical protein